MNVYTTTARASSPTRRTSRADRPFNPDQHCRDSFAREAVIAEFGRHAWALDQADFEDRKPWQMPTRSPEARFK